MMKNVNSLSTRDLGPGVKEIINTQNPVNAVFVVVHGFNVKPEKMATVENLILSHGGLALECALSGHRNNYVEMVEANIDDWVKDARHFLNVGKELARQHDVPLYFLGYSLGGLVELTRATREDDLQYDKYFFLAPPIKLRSLSKIYRYLNIFKRNFNIPSDGLKKYRMYDQLPLSAYNALYEANDEITLQNKSKEIWNIPTRIFIDVKDELIDFEKTVRFINMNRLTNWEVIPITKEKQSFFQRNPHHICIDEYTMNAHVWEKFCNKLVEHFDLNEKKESA